MAVVPNHFEPVTLDGGVAGPRHNFIFDRNNPNLRARHRDTYNRYGFRGQDAVAAANGLLLKERAIPIQPIGSAFFNGLDGEAIPGGLGVWNDAQRANFSPDNLGNHECDTLRHNSYLDCHQGMSNLPRNYIGADDECKAGDDVDTLRDKHNNFMRCRNSRTLLNNSNCWVNNGRPRRFIDPNDVRHLEAIEINERFASDCRQRFDNLPNRHRIGPRVAPRGGVPAIYITNMEAIITHAGNHPTDASTTALENLTRLCAFVNNPQVNINASAAITRLQAAGLVHRYRRIRNGVTVGNAALAAAAAVPPPIAPAGGAAVPPPLPAAAAAVPPPIAAAGGAAVPPPVPAAAAAGGAGGGARHPRGPCNRCGAIGRSGNPCLFACAGTYQGRRTSKKSRKLKRKTRCKII
jgi:hypothetical protein